jgi:hypothetical protein
MAYTDEKEWPISTLVHNNLRHVPKQVLCIVAKHLRSHPMRVNVATKQLAFLPKYAYPYSIVIYNRLIQ